MVTQTKALAVVVDCSGSMAPDLPIVRIALAKIKARTETAGIKMAVWAAPGTNKDPAKLVMAFGSPGANAVKDLAASIIPAGGTTLLPAIKAALIVLKASAVDERILVVIWDGYTSDAAAIAPLVARQKQTRIYQLLLGGSEPQTFLSARAAFGIAPILVSKVADLEKAMVEAIR
jgi:Mg-chelatase subunit ChlD